MFYEYPNWIVKKFHVDLFEILIYIKEKDTIHSGEIDLKEKKKLWSNNEKLVYLLDSFFFKCEWGR